MIGHTEFEVDPNVLSRIRHELGDEAATAFMPLCRKWVRDGFIGGPGFQQVGETFLRLSIEAGGLHPAAAVLDAGCGIGRIALAFLSYLKSPGSYEGFDMVPSGIDWLQRYVSAKYPAFRFRLADGIHSELYNPDGRRDASTYTFPYDDAVFDLAIAVSLFTHMTPPGVSRYFSEVGRVLKPGGRLLCTAYLLESDAPPDADFRHDFGTHRLRSTFVPESAIAFDAACFLRLASAGGLRLSREIQCGSWRNRENLTSQDLVILEKAG